MARVSWGTIGPICSWLDEKRQHGPLTFVGVAVLLMIVAVAACYIPARRAARESR